MPLKLSAFLMFLIIAPAEGFSQMPDKKLWPEITAFESLLSQAWDKPESDWSDKTKKELTAKAQQLWQVFSSRTLTPCTRTAGSLVQYLRTYLEAGPQRDKLFHHEIYLKSREKCLRKLQMNPRTHKPPKMLKTPVF
ncbi:MAG: hypothetical protein ACR2OW_10790 [Methyloligellaceae bacterium]